jgi:hypothetical protein
MMFFIVLSFANLGHAFASASSFLPDFLLPALLPRRQFLHLMRIQQAHIGINGPTVSLRPSAYASEWGDNDFSHWGQGVFDGNGRRSRQAPSN